MRLITWNMQGATGSGESKWVTDVTRLFHDPVNADYVCLQECGQYPPSAQVLAPPPALAWVTQPVGQVPPFDAKSLSWNLGTASRPDIVYVLWMQTDPGGNRNNLAICSRVAPTNIFYSPPARLAGGTGPRPAIGVDAGPVALWTFHAASMGGALNDSPNQLASISQLTGGYCVGADWNLDPAAWHGQPMPPLSVICPNNTELTHPGSDTNLDYAITNAVVHPVTGIVMDDFVVSDHYAVCYDF